VIPSSYSSPSYSQEIEPEEPTIPLSHYLWILKRHCWKIVAFVLTSVMATAIISSRLTPIYESTATVDIDRRMPTGIVGQESEQAPTNDADQFIATQVKLIESDSVLRPVFQKYKLTDAELETPRDKTTSTDAEEAPIVLKNLNVTRPPNTYLLLIGYRSPDKRLAADVANGIANSYIEHTFNIRLRSSASLSSFMEKQLEELKAKMERSSAALVQFEKELNVINPEEKTSILSSRLLQLNTEYTNAQSDRVKKEAAANSVKGGTLEAVQVSSQGEELKKLGERLNEAQEKMAQIKGQYGQHHPEYDKAATQLASVQNQFESTRQNLARRVEVEYQQALSRESMLKKAVAETKTEFDRLNGRSFEYQSLKREAEADKKLYQELVTKIKEAGINAGFQNSAIRMADPARPGLKPVFPRRVMNVALAFLFSTLLGIGLAVLSDTLDTTIRDSEQVRHTLPTEVVGSLPLVRGWHNSPVLALGSRERPAGDQALALSAVSGKSQRHVAPFAEAVRTLRNSILLGNFDRSFKSLLVTSASPSEGKTTVAIHLALANAEQKFKTLLIDCDFRRPSVHQKLNLPKQNGPADAVPDGAHWKSRLLTLPEFPSLDILPAGSNSRRMAGLIGEYLTQILDEASAYDLVIIDSPPLLGFAEPLQMAFAVDGVVVVALAGQTKIDAVSSVLDTLNRIRANVVGLVLNEVTSSTGNGYHYGYNGKYHKYYKTEEPS
jgi:capsular exopolysaccharide synthesis family protein